MGDAVTLALIAIIAAIIPALFKLLNDNTAALKEMSKSNEKIAEATVTGNNEAKERNGHLGEQNIQLAEMARAGNELTKQVLETMRSTAADLNDSNVVVAGAVETVRTDLVKSNNQAEGV